MQSSDIKPEDFLVPAAGIWSDQWLLLPCGDAEAKDYNCMTVCESKYDP
jgi:hypothetical protein